MRKSLRYLLLLPLFSIMLVNCDEDESYKPIEVETKEVVSVDYKSAIITGKIVEFGKGIDAFGHCWSTNPIPSIEDDTTIIMVEVGGDYQSVISGLADEEKYYFRSYALNDEEIVYGEIKVFTTEINPLKLGLVAYYPFDGNTNDYSEYENHATNYGAELTTDRFGNENLAYDFDGLTNYMQLSKDIDASDGLTFAFWINSRGQVEGENNGVVIGKYDMANQRSFIIGSYGFGTDNSTNKIKATYYKYNYTSSYRDNVHSDWILNTLPDGYNPSFYSFYSPTELILDSWNFAVVNVTSQEIQVWINGTLTVIKEREYQFYANDSIEPIYIGNNLSLGGGDNNHLNGKLDDLRIYNRPLTEDEIQALYHEGGWDE